MAIKNNTVCKLCINFPFILCEPDIQNKHVQTKITNINQIVLSQNRIVQNFLHQMRCTAFFDRYMQ